MKDNKIIQVTALMIAISFLLMGCSSTTMIRSRPLGASVYIENIRIGQTPIKHTDSAPLGTAKSIRLEKDGYKPFNTMIRKDNFKVGPFIGGLFVLVPWLWVLGYPNTYEFQLEEL